ncbi:hypothetical protein LX32DRAFT_636813 [Colletotrichum zoysiae]|uniref:Uncharacterized protein n=1 Tax=Colletotrichum zoysiae TaxID=1216348 RepID=A0AAD9HPX0_9PEZI|nr:hypothetical protein LX32DRAFT_636813 [Colletotrichum zoysiae]
MGGCGCASSGSCGCGASCSCEGCPVSWPLAHSTIHGGDCVLTLHDPSTNKQRRAKVVTSSWFARGYLGDGKGPPRRNMYGCAIP